MMKAAGLLLLAVAYFLLVPGLTEPMLTVSGTVEKAKLVELGREMLKSSGNLPAFVADLADRVIDSIDSRGTVSAFDKTRSIIGTASELRANGHLPVAVLIVLFSVVVPLLKALVLGAALAPPLGLALRRRFATLADAVGKWSMADVFVIAIFIAYLAGNGIRDGEGLVDFKASLDVGFWYFLAYCLVSLLGSQLLIIALRRELADDAASDKISQRIDADDESTSSGANVMSGSSSGMVTASGVAAATADSLATRSDDDTEE